MIELTWWCSFTVKLSPPLSSMPVSSCDCSICHTHGYMMVYPLESQITWHSGKDEMVNYTFGPARIAHQFCGRCGTSIGGKSNEKGFFENNRAINVSGVIGDRNKIDRRNRFERCEESTSIRSRYERFPAGARSARTLNTTKTSTPTILTDLELGDVDGRHCRAEHHQQ